MRLMDETAANEREALIREFFPLVRKIARRVHRVVPASDLDDLVGDVCFLLIRAVEMLDG
jgi:DNA-directed RNA polymerase specialized sigma subunit